MTDASSGAGPDGRLRLAVFDEFRLGIVQGQSVVDITELFRSWEPDGSGVNAAIAEWPEVAHAIPHAVQEGRAVSLADCRLRPPVPRPTHLLCAPVNYRQHQGEVEMDRTGEAPASADARQRGFFLKSPGSISGPHDPIELPDLPGREFAYEGEVAVVIGRPTRAVAAAEAWDHVFGLTGFVDVTLRPGSGVVEERSMRKSYATFGPLGPCVLVTSDPSIVPEVGLRLSVNGGVRQAAPLRDLIVDVATLVEMTSHVHALEPGDVIATGTPGGVGPIAPGDVVDLAVEPVGSMELEVQRRGW